MGMKIRHAEDGSPATYRRPDFTSEPGDVVEVDPTVGETLVDEKRYFEAVDDAVDADVEAEEPSSSDEEGSGTEDDDVEAGGNSIPTSPDEEPDDFDADEWLSVDYDERAELVANGEADDYLLSIREAETSETVRDAVDERRVELQTED